MKGKVNKMQTKTRLSGWLKNIFLAAGFLALVYVGTFGQEPAERPIKSLSFQNADMRHVFSILADYAKQNIVVSPTVTGTVTLTLTEVTWQQAMDIILKTYNLAGVQEKGYMRVLPMREHMVEQTDLQRHQVDQKTLVPVETRIISIENATARDMKTAAKAMLSERGFVDSDERTNSLVVRDIPENVAKIESFVKSLDRETKQVKISAQLVEVKSEHLAELGVRWKISDVPYLNNQAYPYDFEQRADEKVTDPVGNLIVSTVDQSLNIESIVRAMVKDDKARILAHPEVTTLDNKKAKIQIGSKIPIKQFDAAGNVTITFFNVGTLLEVTPHVASEKRILLDLKPEQSSFRIEPIGPIIDTKNAETNVMVNNGQTVVIGGLTAQNESKQTIGLPFLKDIPVLGYLFRYTRKQVLNSDLVIFVTPTLVTSETMVPKTGMVESDTQSGN